MNKQKNRYTPFKGKYRMPVDEFCEKYGISLKLIMHRMNILFWEDFDALVIPQELGDTSADKVRRILNMINLNWGTKEIATRMDVDEKIVDHIREMSSYMKDMFLNMDNYFYLNPKNVDLDKIFVEVKGKECEI